MCRLAIVLVLASACSASVDLVDYPEAFHHAQCEFLARCGEAPDVATCLALNTSPAINAIEVTTSERVAVDMGKVSYFGDKARQCVDALATRSCDITSQTYRNMPAACNDIAQGTIGDMGVCAFDAECKSMSCMIPSCGGTTCCPGTCVGDARPVEPTIGEPCAATGACIQGARCDFGSNRCVALKGQGASCVDNYECGYDLGCIGTPRVCGVLPTLGQPCPTGLCRDFGTVCSSPASPTPQICIKVGLAGDACTADYECSLLLRCDATKHCTAGVVTGQTCNFSVRCADYLAFCDIPSGAPEGTCSLPKRNGSPCTFGGYECESFYCDGTTHLCAVAPVCF